jgi:hypothetical protein
MGLDMHLYGVESDDTEVELGYWRKHPNLHGFIVESFAGGVDECQKIPLTLQDISLALAAASADILPPTAGFFFGTSGPHHREHTLEVLNAALAWLGDDSSRRVYYRASW